MTASLASFFISLFLFLLPSYITVVIEPKKKGKKKKDDPLFALLFLSLSYKELVTWPSRVRTLSTAVSLFYLYIAKAKNSHYLP